MADEAGRCEPFFAAEFPASKENCREFLPFGAANLASDRESKSSCKGGLDMILDCGVRHPVTKLVSTGVFLVPFFLMEFLLSPAPSPHPGVLAPGAGPLLVSRLERYVQTCLG